MSSICAGVRSAEAAAELLFEHDLDLTRVALGESFADADDRRHRRRQRGFCLFVHDRIGLAEK